MLFVIVSQVSFTPSGTDMQMMQPWDGPLRRHFLPGVKVEYSVSPRQKAYRVQIHRIQVKRHAVLQVIQSCLLEYILSSSTLVLLINSFILQIQNQLPGAIFPYVFYPVKLPRSITMDSGLVTCLALCAVYMQCYGL